MELAESVISDSGDRGDLLDGWTKPAPGVDLCMGKVTLERWSAELRIRSTKTFLANVTILKRLSVLLCHRRFIQPRSWGRSV